MEINELPKVLTSLISSESVDFAVKAGSKRPFIRCAGEILFGLIFTTATLIFVFIYLHSPEISGESGSGSETGVIVLFALFLLGGVTIMTTGIVKAFTSGGFFAGTPKRLIWYKKVNKHCSYDWSRFSGDIQVKGNDSRGTIRLFMRPENLSRAENESAYVPSVIYITSVRDVLEIERMIRRRIKENDPTPAKR